MKEKNTDIKWIKISTNIFSDEKILLIEQMPDADTIIVIWFKLLALAGRENNCGVFVMGGKMPYTDEMLATIFRRPLQTVRFALQTFEAFGMVEIIESTNGNDIITIPNWEKHQNVDGMNKIREQTRLRVAKHREKQRLVIGNDDNVTECSVTCNDNVTECNATEEEKEKEKEEDKDKDKEKYKEKKNSAPRNDAYQESYKEIIDYLNLKAGTNYLCTTKKTQSCIHARLSEGFTIDDFKIVIDKKCKEWIGTEFEKYIRPETLFGTKFEGYLNSKINPKNAGNADIKNRVSNVDDW